MVIRSYNQIMTRVTDAIFSNGVLKPIEPLPLREQERVRVTVETIGEHPNGDRSAALARLRAGRTAMRLRSDGPYPTRDELHERR